LTPWYLFSGADSLSQGLDLILLAIAVILAIALVGGATYTFERRDLKG
jgi:hypothetical protein